MALVAGAPALPRAVEAPLAEDAGTDRGVLFHLTRGGSTVLLYGTIHVGAPSFYPLPPTVMRPLRRAELLLVEADIASAALPALFRAHGMQPADRPPARIAPAKAEAVDAALRSAQVDPAFARRFKPDVLASVLGAAAARQLGLTTDYAVDAFLIGFARALRIPVLELEGVARQLTANDDLPPGDTQSLLDEAVDGLVNGENLRAVTRTVRAWQQHDLEALARAVPTGGSPAAMRRARRMEDRNTGMAQSIAGHAASRATVFAAVGVLHLVGPTSVQQQLLREGFLARRVY